MAKGNAILDYADEEGRQPLLAQYHEDGHLFLTFFDVRTQAPVLVTTHQGAEPFLRRAADLVDDQTYERQELAELKRARDTAIAQRDRLVLLIQPFLRQMKKESNILDPHEALRVIVTEWEVLKSAAQAQQTDLAALQHKYHTIVDPLEQWAVNQDLSYGSLGDILRQVLELAEAGKLLPEENRVLRMHVEQSQTDLHRKSVELRDAQEMLASLNYALNRSEQTGFNVVARYPRLEEYCSSRGLMASEEIPF